MNREGGATRKKTGASSAWVTGTGRAVGAIVTASAERDLAVCWRKEK